MSNNNNNNNNNDIYDGMNATSESITISTSAASLSSAYSLTRTMPTAYSGNKRVSVPAYLVGVEIIMDPEGKSISCAVCKTCDNRASTKHGKVTCARGRLFKFDSIKNYLEKN